MSRAASSLLSRIESREATIAVVGLGHVGLPLATALAAAGFRVLGIDIDDARVSDVARGRLPWSTSEPHLRELLEGAVDGGRLAATTRHAVLADADAVLVCVETPIGRDHRPRFDALTEACRTIAAKVRAGTLVVIESTVAPGTCASLRPLFGDILFGHCPERVMPGLLVENLRGLPRVVGAWDEASAAPMLALYGSIVRAPLRRADCATAEVVKTAENAYRDVNLAFANELARICEASGVDFREVRTLVNDSPGREVLFAGVGVGGACLPKDTWLLATAASAAGFDARLLAAARAVNEQMPAHTARLVESALGEAGHTVRGATVVILGFAYLPNTDGTTHSPSAALRAILEDRGVSVRVHDPHVREHTGDLVERVRGADALVLAVAHDAYRAIDRAGLAALAAAMGERPALVDGRHVIDARDARDAGFAFRALGRG